MALFQAFQAVRPAADKAERVAALPYDVVNREEAREILAIRFAFLFLFSSFLRFSCSFVHFEH